MSTAIIDSLRSEKFQRIYRQYGVSRISLFGSFARGEENENSDVDLLVEQEQWLDLKEYFAFREEMENSLHRKVDIVNKERINPILERYISKDLITIK